MDFQNQDFTTPSSLSPHTPHPSIPLVPIQAFDRVPDSQDHIQSTQQLLLQAPLSSHQQEQHPPQPNPTLLSQMQNNPAQSSLQSSLKQITGVPPQSPTNASLESSNGPGVSPLFPQSHPPASPSQPPPPQSLAIQQSTTTPSTISVMTGNPVNQPPIEGSNLGSYPPSVSNLHSHQPPSTTAPHQPHDQSQQSQIDSLAQNLLTPYQSVQQLSQPGSNAAQASQQSIIDAVPSETAELPMIDHAMAMDGNEMDLNGNPVGLPGPSSAVSWGHPAYQTRHQSNQQYLHNLQHGSDAGLGEMEMMEEEEVALGGSRGDKSRAGSSCHQCKSRRTVQHLVYCTATVDRKTRSCKKKYCQACVKKFYKETLSLADRQTWVCPACRRFCCCAACRRRKDKDEVNTGIPISINSPALVELNGGQFLVDLCDYSETGNKVDEVSVPNHTMSTRSRDLRDDVSVDYLGLEHVHGHGHGHGQGQGQGQGHGFRDQLEAINHPSHPHPQLTQHFPSHSHTHSQSHRHGTSHHLHQGMKFTSDYHFVEDPPFHTMNPNDPLHIVHPSAIDISTTYPPNHFSYLGDLGGMPSLLGKSVHLNTLFAPTVPRQGQSQGQNQGRDLISKLPLRQQLDTAQLAALQHLSPLTHGTAPTTLPPLTSLAATAIPTTTSTTATTTTTTVLPLPVAPVPIKRKAPYSELDSPQMGAASLSLIKLQFSQAHPHLAHLNQPQATSSHASSTNPVSLHTPVTSAILSRPSQTAGNRSETIHPASSHPIPTPPVLQLQFPTSSEHTSSFSNNSQHHAHSSSYSTLRQPFPLTALTQALAPSPRLPLASSPIFPRSLPSSTLNNLVLHRDPYQDFLQAFGEVCQTPIATSIAVLTSLQNVLQDAHPGPDGNTSGNIHQQNTANSSGNSIGTGPVAAAANQRTESNNSFNVTKLAKSHSGHVTGQAGTSGSHNTATNSQSSVSATHFSPRQLPLRQSSSSIHSPFTVVTPPLKPCQPNQESRLLLEYLNLVLQEEQQHFSGREVSNSIVPSATVASSSVSASTSVSVSASTSRRSLTMESNTRDVSNPKAQTPSLLPTILDVPVSSTDLKPHGVGNAGDNEHGGETSVGDVIGMARKMFNPQHPKFTCILSILTPVRGPVHARAHAQTHVQGEDKATMNDEDEGGGKGGESSDVGSHSDKDGRVGAVALAQSLAERLSILAAFLTEEIPQSSKAVVPESLLDVYLSSPVLPRPVSAPLTPKMEMEVGMDGSQGGQSHKNSQRQQVQPQTGFDPSIPTPRNQFSWYRFLFYTFHPTHLSRVIRSLHQQIQLRHHLATNPRQNIASRPGSGTALGLSHTWSGNGNGGGGNPVNGNGNGNGNGQLGEKKVHHHHHHHQRGLSSDHHLPSTPLSINFSPLLHSGVPHAAPPRLTELGSGSALHQQLYQNQVHAHGNLKTLNQPGFLGARQLGNGIHNTLHNSHGGSNHSGLHNLTNTAHPSISTPRSTQSHHVPGLDHISSSHKDLPAISPRHIQPLTGHFHFPPPPLPSSASTGSNHLQNHPLGPYTQQLNSQPHNPAPNVASALLLNQTLIPNTSKNRTLHVSSRSGALGTSHASFGAGDRNGGAGTGNLSEQRLLSAAFAHLHTISNPSPVLNAAQPLSAQNQNGRGGRTLLDLDRGMTLNGTKNFISGGGSGSSTRFLDSSDPTPRSEQSGGLGKLHELGNGNGNGNGKESQRSEGNEGEGDEDRDDEELRGFKPLDFSQLVQLSPHASHVVGHIGPLAPLKNLADLTNADAPGFLKSLGEGDGEGLIQLDHTTQQSQ